MPDNGSLDFELEQEEDLDENSLTENERRLVTQAFDFTVKSLSDQIEDGTIAVDETWQRKYVWDDKKASRLIESLLLNVPIPVCYFAEETSGQYLVIDGQQRLWSIYRYLDNQFPLKGLKTLAELNGKRFHQLDKKEQRFIKTRTLRCIALTQESHPEIRFDVFERLNTGSVSLNPQELRHCMYRGVLNNLLSELCTINLWLKCLRRDGPDDRFRDQELILRFLAFHYRLNLYRPPLSKFLNDFMRDHRKMNPGLVEQYKNLFISTVEKVQALFGEHCFRRLINIEDGNLIWDKNINKALFDLEMLLSSHLTVEECTTKAKMIRDLFIELMTDPTFIDLLLRSTDHKNRVYGRFNLLLKKLKDNGIGVKNLDLKIENMYF